MVELHEITCWLVLDASRKMRGWVLSTEINNSDASGGKGGQGFTLPLNLSKNTSQSSRREFLYGIIDHCTGGFYTRAIYYPRRR
jgi:hypothetical protein